MRNQSVLFLVFNRPHTTAQVMAAIRAARPARLYVAADGPREGHHGEPERCAEARRIATEVDWPCQVRTLFRDTNLGCRVGVSTAIDWFFEYEEEGIILEDDCVPSQSFFPYCAELLDRYRDDQRIMCISGDSFQNERPITPYSYYFSRYNHVWGWATWRRAWQLYDPRMEGWTKHTKRPLLEYWGEDDPGFVQYWTDIFDHVAAQKIDTWDYQWTFCCWAYRGLTCLPARNLVTNIGFGPDATHTQALHRSAHLRREEIEFPLRHPVIVMRDLRADRFTHIHHFGVRFDCRMGVIRYIHCLARWIPLATDIAAFIRHRRMTVINDGH
jgi:hypothetical protein